MENEIRVQDNVQLLHGYSYQMTVSEIDESTAKALCVYLDAKAKKIKQEWLPLNCLKRTPPKTPISLDFLR